MRDEISLGTIYIGTLVGAGLASGQEIISFFTIYGIKGLFGIAVASMLFFFFGYAVLARAINLQSECVSDVLLPVMGKKLMFLFEIIVDIFCFAGYYIMLAGCGAALQESFNLNYTLSIVFINIIIVASLKKKVSGLANFNKLMVSIILIIISIIVFFTLRQNPHISLQAKEGWGNMAWLASSLLYVSYNAMMAVVVLSSLGSYTENPTAALGAAAFGSLGLMAVAVLMWTITSIHFTSLTGVQIPLLWIAKKYGSIVHLISVILLLAAMLSTAIGLGFSFAKGFSRMFKIKYCNALFLLFLGIPISGWNFADLIKKVYPFFGIIGIFFGILLVIRRFLSS